MLNALVLSVLMAYASAQNLCADINTSDSRPVSDIYQSEGKCRTTCTGKFAYAVIQSSNCWCTNYTPDKQTQKNGCNLPCPGYPFEMCGGSSRYSYVLLNSGLVLGLKDGKESTTDASSQISTTATTSPTSTMLPSVTTIDGVARTVTVIPTAKATADSDSTSTNGTKLSTILGIVFGTIGGIAVVAIGIIWFIYKRKHADEDDKFESISPMRPEDMSRDSIDNLSNPFSDARISPFSHSLYSWRNRSGSLEYVPEKESVLRIANPDPEPPES